MKINGLDKSIEYDTHKADWTVAASILTSSSGVLGWPQPQMSYAFDGIVDGAMSLQYTDWSLAQLCSRLGIPVSYMRACPHELRDININYWLAAPINAERMFLVRGYYDKARAVLSDRYVPISNSNVMQSVQDVLDIEPKHTCHVTPDYMYLKMLALTIPDGLYSAGVVIQNGEIGDYALRIAPFVQKHSCSNSIVFLDGGFYMRHVSQVSHAYLRATIKEKVAVALGVAGDYAEKVIAAELEEIPNISAVIDNICVMKGYTSEVKTKIIVGTEGRSTRGAVAQGLSYAAHEMEDHRLTMDLESAAGYYLTGRWVVAPEEIE